MIKKSDRIVGLSNGAAYDHKINEKKYGQQNSKRVLKKQRSKSNQMYPFVLTEDQINNQIRLPISDAINRNERMKKQYSQNKKYSVDSSDDMMPNESSIPSRRHLQPSYSQRGKQMSICGLKNFREDDQLIGQNSNINAASKSNMTEWNKRRVLVKQKSRSMNRIVMNRRSHDHQLLNNHQGNKRKQEAGNKNIRTELNSNSLHRMESDMNRSEYMTDSSESLQFNMENQINLPDDSALQNLSDMPHSRINIQKSYNLNDRQAGLHSIRIPQIQQNNQQKSYSSGNSQREYNRRSVSRGRNSLIQSNVRQLSESSSDDDTVKRFQTFFKEKYKLVQPSESGQEELKENENNYKNDDYSFSNQQMASITTDFVSLMVLLRLQNMDGLLIQRIAAINLLAISLLLQVVQLDWKSNKERVIDFHRDNKYCIVASALGFALILVLLPVYNLKQMIQSLQLVQMFKVFNQLREQQECAQLSYLITLLFVSLNLICQVVQVSFFEFWYRPINSICSSTIVMQSCAVNCIFIEFYQLTQSYKEQRKEKASESKGELRIWERIESELLEFRKNDNQEKNCSVRGKKHAQSSNIPENLYNGSVNEENYDKVCSMNNTIHQAMVTSQSAQFDPLRQFQLSSSMPLGSYHNVKSHSKLTFHQSNFTHFEHQLFKILKHQVMVFKVSRQNPSLLRAQTNSDNDESHAVSCVRKSLDSKPQVLRNKSLFIPVGNSKGQSNQKKRFLSKISLIHLSERFFEELPFYPQIEHLHKQRQQSQFPNSSLKNSSGELLMLQSRDQNCFLKQIESNNSHLQPEDSLINNPYNLSSISFQPSALHTVKQSDNVNKIKNDLQVSQLNEQIVQSQMNAEYRHVSPYLNQGRTFRRVCNSDNEGTYQQRDFWPSSLLKPGSKKNTMTGQQIILSELQQEMMDLKIFEPYFINNQTKIEYKRKQLSLSIRDILQECTKFQKGQSQKRLYFRVNKNDSLIVNLMNMRSNSTNKQPPSTLKKSLLVNNDSQLLYSMIRNMNESQIIDNPIEDKQHKKYQLMKSIQEDERNNDSFDSSDYSQMDGCIQRDKRKQQDKQLDDNYDIQGDIDMNKSLSANSDSSVSQYFTQQTKMVQSDDENGTKHDDDQMIYYEFELIFIEKMRKGQHEYEECFILNIKDITYPIRGQKIISDEIYQQAIEGNYSHCQMTPLNFLTQSSSLIKSKVSRLFNQNQKLLMDMFEVLRSKSQLISLYAQFDQRLTYLMAENTQITDDVLRISEDNEQSSHQLWFLNQGQIKRIQILQNRFQSTQSVVDDVSEQFQRSFQNFKKDLIGKQLNVFVAFKDFPEQSMQADWDNLNLILFNLVHNSIKFNYHHGEILIILSTKKHKKGNNRSISKSDINQKQNIFQMSASNVSQDLLLDIQIIDTGEGISQERQQLLFTPFSELKQMNGLIQKPKNDNIGLGLSASRQIARELKGDLTIKQSQRGLTIFRLRFPIKIVQSKKYSSSKSNSGMNNQKNTQNIIQQSQRNKHAISVQPGSALIPPYSSKEVSSLVDGVMDNNGNFTASKIMQLYGQKRASFSEKANSKRNNANQKQLNKFEDVSEKLNNFLCSNYNSLYKKQIEFKVNDNRLIDQVSSESYQFDHENAKSCLRSVSRKINKVELQQNPRCRSSIDLRNFSNFNANGSKDSLNNSDQLAKSEQIKSKDLIQRCNALMKDVQQNKYSQQQLHNYKEMIADQDESSSNIDPSSLSGHQNAESSNQQKIYQSEELPINRSNPGSGKQPVAGQQSQRGHSNNHILHINQISDKPSEMQAEHSVEMELSNSQIFQKIPILINQKKLCKRLKQKSKEVQSNDPKIQKEMKIKMMIHNGYHPVNKQQFSQNEPKSGNSQVNFNVEQLKPINRRAKYHSQKEEIKNKFNLVKSKINSYILPQQSDKVFQRSNEQIHSNINCLNNKRNAQIAQNVIQNLIVQDIDVNSETSEFEENVNIASYRINSDDLQNNFIQIQFGNEQFIQQQLLPNNQNNNQLLQQSQQPNINIINQNEPIGSIKLRADSIRKQLNHRSSGRMQQFQNKAKKHSQKQLSLKKERRNVSKKKINSFERFEEEKQPYNSDNQEMQILRDEFDLKMVPNLSADDNYRMVQYDQQNAHQSLSSIEEDEEMRQSSRQSCGNNQSLKQQDFEQIRSSGLDELGQINEVVSNQDQDGIFSLLNNNILNQNDIRGNQQMRQRSQPLLNRQSERSLKQPKGNIAPNQSSMIRDKPQDCDHSINSIQKYKQTPQDQINGDDQQMIPKLSVKRPRPKSIQNFQPKYIIEQHQIINSRDCSSLNESCNCRPMILVVDDNAFNLEIQSNLILEYLQQHYGIQNAQTLIHQATDGTEAVSLVKQCLRKQCKCRNRVYKMILMDLQMQQMNGNEASVIINKLVQDENQMRQQQYLHLNGEDVQITCNIVACTANTTEHWSQLARDSGMVYMTNKPLTKTKIQHILNEWYYDEAEQIFQRLG